MRKLQALAREREELKRMLDDGELEKEENEDYIRRMEYEINEKERKLTGIIEELTRKSNLNEDELLFLKQEIDKERRKSLADDQKIQKLEQILAESSMKTEEKIKLLSDELER